MILRMKLHMTKLLANFTNKGEERRCRLCNEEDETDEHMMECRKVKNMWKHMNLNRSYIESENVSKNLKAAKIIEAVEKVLEFRKI